MSGIHLTLRFKIDIHVSNKREEKPRGTSDGAVVRGYKEIYSGNDWEQSIVS